MQSLMVSAWIKLLLMIINLTFWVSAITFLALKNELSVLQGSYEAFFLTHDFNLLTSNIEVYSWFLLGLASFGLIGTWATGQHRIHGCLCLSLCLLLPVVIYELMVGASGYALGTQDITHNMYMAQYNATEIWNTMQKELHCCGVNNYTDWASQGQHVPDSCCKNYTVDCGLNMILSFDADEKLYVNGCAAELSKNVKHKADVLFGSCISFFVMQVITVILSILFNVINKRDNNRSKATPQLVRYNRRNSIVTLP